MWVQFDNNGNCVSWSSDYVDNSYPAPEGFLAKMYNVKLVDDVVVLIPAFQYEIEKSKKNKLEFLRKKINEAKKIVLQYGEFVVVADIALCQEVMVRKFANGDVFDYDIDGTGYSLIGIPREIAHNLQSECERIRTDLRVYEKYYENKIESANTVEELDAIEFGQINIRGKTFGIDLPFVFNIQQDAGISVVRTYGDD